MNRNPETDRYGDGDIPREDYSSCEDNGFDPHPQAAGENSADKNDEKNNDILNNGVRHKECRTRTE